VPIGKGTNGTVHKGIDRKRKRPVAVKIVNNLAKAKSEAKIMRKYKKHKYLVTLYDFFISRGKGYLIMEWVPGQTLGTRKAVLWYGKKHSLKTAARYAIRILQAASYLRSKGISHNDINPSNIVIKNPKKYQIKIIDFGSSRQSTSQNLYSRDTYKTAIILAMLVTGKVTFRRLKKGRILRVPARFPNPAFQWVMRKALHQNPHVRFKQPSDLIKRLKRFAKS